MDESDFTLAGFEIIGLERLGSLPVHQQVESITRVLQNSGFGLIPQSDRSKIIRFFGIENKALVVQLAKRVFADAEDELVWLATEFFQYYFVLPTKYDLLFGFASINDPEKVGPYGRPPNYILSEIGDYTYRPSIPRILIADALVQGGSHELGKSLECTTSFPREIALAGDIVFVDPPIKYDLRLTGLDKGYEWRSLSLLSSRLLIQGVARLLQDESSLCQVEIAKVFPFQFFSVALVGEEQHPFSLLNHFSIRARKGSFAEVLDELLGVSLHLNWSRAKEYTEQLRREESIRYALMQNIRLKQVEDKEQRLVYSLGVLQKRYPSRLEIIEWEVSNLYSNLVRFSPVYLDWKTHLQAYIQGTEQVGYRFANLIGQLDWYLLEENGIASKCDGERIIELLKVDPPSTLTRMRVVIERIVSFLFRHQFPSLSPKRPLASKLQKLSESNAFPPLISIYLDTLRLTGNIGAHEAIGTREDVEAVLPIFLRVVEWFVGRKL